MKNPSLLIFLSLAIATLKVDAQTMAITEFGDTIYVHDNGTWSFDSESEALEFSDQLNFLELALTIDTVDTEFLIPRESKKQIKNSRGQFEIFYNDKEWKRIPPGQVNGEAEFAFQSKSNDIWSMVISEETPIPSDNLLRIAKYTMETRTGGTAEILTSELVTVNGSDLIHGVLACHISGISFIFDTYYYSDERGSVQFTVWSSDKIWEREKAIISELLNGFNVSP